MPTQHHYVRKGIGAYEPWIGGEASPLPMALRVNGCLKAVGEHRAKKVE